MIYLVDTNVLLQVGFRHQAQHAVARAAVVKLRQNGDQLLLTAQGCVEFWNVATRPPTSNGLGISLDEAERVLRFIERAFQRLPPAPDVYPTWRSLVISFGVTGVKVFDARLVAAMQVHNITHILTFNTRDFTRYASLGIVAVAPATV